MEHANTSPVAQLRAALEGARDALATEGDGTGVVGDVLARLSGVELAEFMTLADQVKALAGAAQIRLTAEAAHRGEFTAARRGEGSAQAWVRQHGPSLCQGGAGWVAQLGADVAASNPDGVWGPAGPHAGAYADPDAPEGIVWGRVLTGEIGPALALTALRETARMTDLVEADLLPAATTAMLDYGVARGCAEARRIRPHLIAAYGREGEFDDQEKKLRAGAYLSSPQVADGELTEYRMAMTPEQAARFEAAIEPLSKPAPNDTTGERDLRPAGQRRVEALAAVCGRVAGTDAATADPGGARNTLHVGMNLADLLNHLSTDDDTTSSTTRADTRPETGGAGTAKTAAPGAGTGAGGRTGCGRVLLTRAQATILAPATVRQLACDADLIPIVFGSEGEVLDVGRAVRLFTRAQRRALWHRDRGCTYPGCDVPAGWCQAHHLVHWVDGGPSDLQHAALLCPRHHTQVHDQRLTGTVHPPDEHGRSVTWDLAPGSYDRDLPELLTAIRRVHAKAHATATAARARAVERARLDTGPPDPWASEPPDELITQWVEQWMAEDATRESDSAWTTTDLDDALAILLTEEAHAATSSSITTTT